MQLADEHRHLRETVARFAAEEINPDVKTWAPAEQFPPPEVFGMIGPLGVKIRRKMADPGPISHMRWRSGAQADMCAPALARLGATELRKELPRPAIRGEAVGCIGVSESGSGWDVAATRTRARLEGDDDVSDGRKTWVADRMQADWCRLLVDGEVAAAHNAKSLHAIPMDSRGIGRTR